MHFRSSCQFFVLVGADRLYFSTLLTFESALGVNKKVVEDFLSFPESLGLPLFDAYSFSYG